jgi:hypothetical protein
MDNTVHPAPRSLSRNARVLIPVITAILTLLGAGIAAVLQGRANLALENQRFRSQLILQAIQTGDPRQAASNLRLLLQTHLLLDPDSALGRYLDTTKALPVLPSMGHPEAYTPGNLPSGDTKVVHLMLSYEADIEWYRDITPENINAVSAPLGPQQDSFPIGAGGIIYVRAKPHGTSNYGSPVQIDCRWQSRCAATIP